VRVDGSLRTVSAGISTLDDLRQPGFYSKYQLNFRNDLIEGLTRRPPAKFVKTIMEDFIPGRDACIPVEIGIDEYWVFIQSITTANLVRVFSSDGTEIPVNVEESSAYFNSLGGTKDVAHAVFGNHVVLANRNVKVLKNDTLPLVAKNSMVVVNQAPDIFTQLKVQWIDSEGNQKTAEVVVNEDTFPTDSTSPDLEKWLSIDRGTNTTAAVLVGKMLEQNTADEILIQGSTIVIKRADGEYADVTTEDGAGNTVLIPINSEVSSPIYLPKYAPVDSVITVRPDPNSDSGMYYMRSTPVAEKSLTDLGPPDATLNSEYFMFNFLTGAWGFIDWEGKKAGSISPTSVNGNNYQYAFFIDNSPVNDEIRFSLLFDASGTPFPEDTAQWITIIDSVSGKKVIDSALNVDIGPPLAASTSYKRFDPLNNWDYLIYYKKLPDEYYGEIPEVTWKESTHPEQKFSFNESTLPHVLTRLPDNTFTYGTPRSYKEIPGMDTWQAREAGDDKTNPFPAFIERKINDIGRFQNRLVVLSEDNLSMSVSSFPTDFFRGTVSQLLVTSPINIKSTAQEASDLKYIVSHNKDALIFSRKGQYKLDSSVPVTPENATLSPSAQYDTPLVCSPVSTGKDVYFSTSYGSTSGLSRYKALELTEQDESVQQAHHVSKLIGGDVELLAGSSTRNILLLKAKAKNILYAFEYNYALEIPQKAWSIWEIGDDSIEIIGIRVIDERISLSVLYNKDVILLDLILQNEPEVSDKDVYLDFRVEYTGVTNSLTIPEGYPIPSLPSLRVVQGADSPEPYQSVPFTRSGNTLTLEKSLEGGSCFLGYQFYSKWIPPKIYVRDSSYSVIMGSKLRITDYWVSLVSDELVAKILSPVDTYDEQVYSGKKNPSTGEGTWRISYKQKNTTADLELISTHYTGTRINQLEYRGTYIKSGRRI